MTQTQSPLYTGLLRTVLASSFLLLAGCIYRIDIQQGSYLDREAVDQVEVGMSRSAVRFLLGTPTVTDPFHANRWDYPYYLKRGRQNDSEASRRWVIVYFEGDEVASIERDVSLDPAS